MEFPPPPVSISQIPNFPTATITMNGNMGSMHGVATGARGGTVRTIARHLSERQRLDKGKLQAARLMCLGISLRPRALGYRLTISEWMTSPLSAAQVIRMQETESRMRKDADDQNVNALVNKSRVGRGWLDDMLFRKERQSWMGRQAMECWGDSIYCRRVKSECRGVSASAEK